MGVGVVRFYRHRESNYHYNHHHHYYYYHYYDDITRIFHVFEMWIGMNEFDHRILALLKQHQEKPEKLFRPFLLLLKQC